jgi:hypothetical protein
MAASAVKRARDMPAILEPGRRVFKVSGRSPRAIPSRNALAAALFPLHSAKAARKGGCTPFAKGSACAGPFSF